MHMPNKPDERNLLALTNLPTVPGGEQRVIQWVTRWAGRRKWVQVRRDEFGNMLLSSVSARSRRPIIFTAHMDHPGFVVTRHSGAGHDVEAKFLGGVADRYFKGSAVRLYPERGACQRGRITKLHRARGGCEDKLVTVRFAGPVQAKCGDMMTWDIADARIRGRRLHAPACDDLAGVAAALGAFEKLGKAAGRGGSPRPDVRVLLTRGEEVGFVGAIGAAKSGLIRRQARLIALENSKSFADSPIGGGPIARVGDRTSTFDPDLTYSLCQIAGQLGKEDASFIWQRRLMSGGTCEATAYQALGFRAACLCLGLGNYHNMADRGAGARGREKIVAEVISLRDYHSLIQWLVAIGRYLDDPAAGISLSKRLEALFTQRKKLLR